MNTAAKPTPEVGVIIGRFQTPRLHKAHHSLIEAVFQKHKKVIILLGVSPIKLSKRDPLDYMSREIMIKKAYPKAVVLPVEDRPLDSHWSTEVDNAIRSTVGASPAMLYGSRDSFIPHYKGKHTTTELPSSFTVSATAAREAASAEVRGEEAWRIGVIYATSQRFLISYQCVDAIVWKYRRKAGWHDESTVSGIEGIDVLLGRKKTDPIGRYRFLGGFVDPEDMSLEDAAKREAFEESGESLTFFSCEYVHSVRVDDWRYKKEKDKILTSVFLLEYLTGDPVPSDDIDELEWVDVNEVGGLLVDSHGPLWPKVWERLQLPKATN